MTLRLEFFRDAGEFLAVTGEHLTAEPVVSTVVTTAAHRATAQASEGIPQPDPYWWLAVRDEAGTVVGAGMRTAPFEPHPLFLLPMPAQAAASLARLLHERGEQVVGVNGALPAAQLCAAELARLINGSVEVAQHTRLFELGELRSPRSVPGRLAAATEHDVDLAIEWFAAFGDDADEQAGRAGGASAQDVPDRTALLHRIRGGELWFWLDAQGRRVHLTAAHPPSFGVARIGPVYTPAAQRGHGWASNAVAAVSGQLQARGVRVCLFTDQANPTSNKIYAALGYRPVVDMANLMIIAP
jgi:predicted GNAT family acetyltransferase